MSRADDKRNVLNNIKAYNSMNRQGNVPIQRDGMSSINNSKDSIPFLLDTLKAIAGAAAVKMLLGSLLTKMIKGSEANLKKGLKKQFIQSNANEQLPTTFTNNGINMPVNSIDTNGKLKIEPNSVNKGGLILYGQPNFNNFDYKAHDAIVANGTPVECNNIKITYDSNTDGFNIKSNGSSTNIGDFFSNYIDDTQLINSDEIVANTMDRIFGTLSKEQEKTKEQILDELILEKMLENLMNGNDSFELSPNELNELDTLANQLSNGVVNHDMGCGIIQTQLSIDDFNKMINDITNTDDPNVVSNAIDDAINSSVSSNDDVFNKNKEAIQENFIQKIINTLVIKMITAVTTAPQIRMLMGVMNGFQNQGQAMLTKAKDDVKKWKIMIKCMVKEIILLVVGFIVTFVFIKLKKMLEPIIRKKMKEKIDNFKKIIKSLTSVVET